MTTFQNAPTDFIQKDKEIINLKDKEIINNFSGIWVSISYWQIDSIYFIMSSKRRFSHVYKICNVDKQHC